MSTSNRWTAIVIVVAALAACATESSTGPATPAAISGTIWFCGIGDHPAGPVPGFLDIEPVDPSLPDKHDEQHFSEGHFRFDRLAAGAHYVLSARPAPPRGLWRIWTDYDDNATLTMHVRAPRNDVTINTCSAR